MKPLTILKVTPAGIEQTVIHKGSETKTIIKKPFTWYREYIKGK